MEPIIVMRSTAKGSARANQSLPLSRKLAGAQLDPYQFPRVWRHGRSESVPPFLQPPGAWSTSYQTPGFLYLTAAAILKER